MIQGRFLLGLALLMTNTLLWAVEPDKAFDDEVNLPNHTVKLSPHIRSEPIELSVPEIPLETIQSFLVNHRIVASNELDHASYIVAGQDGHIVMGKGDVFYARGKFAEPVGTTFGIYQQGELYKDPDSKETLGLELLELGLARIEQVNGDVATFRLLSSNRNISVGDRLLPTLEQKLNPIFSPTPPKNVTEGKIIQVVDGVRNIGQYSSVVINRGTREGLESGNLLAVYSQGEVVRDKINDKLIPLPPNQSGLLMVYRVFDKVSFGLVLKAANPLSVMDIVKNP